MGLKIISNKRHRKHWIQLGIQIFKLYLNKKNKQTDLTNLSYNKISCFYDDVWNNHMNIFSRDLINRLSLPTNGLGLDLTCGTGYVTGLLSKKIKGEVIGVDISREMLKIAEQKYGDKCRFVCCDVLEYLNKQPSKSVDVITCAWGLGFTKPFKVIKEISRILKPNGKVGIIDNSLFTVYEVTIAGISTVSEYPSAISNIMNVRWLPTVNSLTIRMKINGLKVLSSWKGEKTYYAKNGNELVECLIKTGTSAGYDNCFKKQYSEIIKHRFIEIFDKLYITDKGMPMTHRFIAAIAKKP